MRPARVPTGWEAGFSRPRRRCPTGTGTRTRAADPRARRASAPPRPRRTPSSAPCRTATPPGRSRSARGCRAEAQEDLQLVRVAAQDHGHLVRVFPGGQHIVALLRGSRFRRGESRDSRSFPGQTRGTGKGSAGRFSIPGTTRMSAAAHLLQRRGGLVACRALPSFTRSRSRTPCELASASSMLRVRAAPLCDMARWNKPRAGGEISRERTSMPPADSPVIVTRCGSPPKASMFSRIHFNAWMMSSVPKLPEASSGEAPSRRAGVREPAERSQAVVHRNEHHAGAGGNPVAVVVGNVRGRAGGVATPVDPHVHGKTRLLVPRSPDVQVQAVFRPEIMPGITALNCVQPPLKAVSRRTPCQGTGSCGARQRRSPTGGRAKGMAFQTQVPSASSWPRTTPNRVVTSGDPVQRPPWPPAPREARPRRMTRG